MGTVVKITDRQRKSRTDPAHSPNGAQIIIYPGIRIERHSVDLSRRVCDITRPQGRKPRNRP